MKNIIFIAPPAAGKGTMSSLLKAKYGYMHISTGDLLRDAKNQDNELGRKLVTMLSSGKLVPDEIVLELLEKSLDNRDKDTPFILDGYPRNLSQVDSLLNLFKKDNIDNYIAIYLDIDYEKAMHRTLGRLTCKNCGNSYNKYIEATRPKVDGICDNCGSKLEIRSDDNEETFKIRYDEYMNNTKPVVDYFNKINRLGVVNVTDNLEETLLQVEKYLEV